MARPVEIDRNQAFLDAYDLFWRRGYQSTSLQHLLDAMGIGRGSFYAAFESKESLFSRAMAEYHNRTVQLFVRIRETQKGVSALRAFFDETLINISTAERRKGCLAVNSALELADVDERLHKSAVAVLDTLKEELEQILNEAQILGELAPERSPEDIASLLLAVLQGLRVTSRTGSTRAEIQNTLYTFIETITHH